MEKKKCTAALVLGIIGIVVGLFIPIIGLGCSVAGIIVACVKKEEMNVKAGLIVSIIGCVVSVASWVLSAVMIANMMSAGQ